MRSKAIDEIWSERGFEGVRGLLSASGAPETIGHYTALCLSGTEPKVDFIQRCLSIEGDLRGHVERCLKGFLRAVEVDSRISVLEDAIEGLGAEERTRLLACAPLEASTWRFMDDLGEGIPDAYWRAVFPTWGQHTPAELTELIDRLLEVRRPQAAFHAVHMNLNDVETARLKRLLRDVGTVGDDSPGRFTIDRYYLSAALDVLNGRAGMTEEEMAQLEFLFIDALYDSEHGIRNLESQIAQSPSVYAQAVALAYKRSDDGEDPPERRVDGPEQRAAAANAAYRLLDQVKKIPGTGEDGRIDAAALARWLAEVRRQFRELARTRVRVGDHCLGQLLAKAPQGESAMWPCEPVCEALEEMASPEIGRGFAIGVYNSRGGHFRSEDGGARCKVPRVG